MPDHSERALATHASDAGALPDGIHRIALPTPFPIGRVNIYLLEGEPLTLVDTGVNTGTSLDILEQVLGGLGYRIEDIELLLLTHEHVDHVGLSTVIARRADCPVAAYAPLGALWDPEQDPTQMLAARLGWGVIQLERHGYPRELVIGAQPAFHLMSALGSRPVIDVALRPGDTIRAGSRDWEVLHRPGHSPSDLMYVDRSTGTALAGDHILGATSSNPVLSPPLEVPMPDPTTERLRSLPMFIESMRQTAADELSLVLPGHGPLVGPPAPLVAERLAFHEKRAAKFLGMLDAAEPQTVYDLATRMWKGVVMVQPTLTHSEMIGHLDLLEDDGCVEEVVIGDGVVGFIAPSRS
jgi:glyoxylase-like metal-dependent hydrolase (beta-lactamase superfamily II)